MNNTQANPLQADLSRLPQIEQLLAAPEVAPWAARLSRPLVARLAARTVARMRDELRAARATQASPGGAGAEPPAVSAPRQEVLAALEEACRAESRKRIGRVINATGVVLHTNLGRAPLGPEVWRAAEGANAGYASLELDLDSGKRGSRRSGLIPELVGLLTGAEDALVVNNNAAAVFFVLSALAAGKEVIVSRGEQVQIGGGFRIPEILSRSGSRLVEVGTTNITTLEDYTRAIGPDTAMVLLVHSSNFRIRGFTYRPAVSELARAVPVGVLLVADQGSGATSETLPGEQPVARYLKAGAHLVCFSADKLLGGPQAGLIAGRASLVRSLARHPLHRVFRPGKTVYSLLEESLVHRLNGGSAGPVQAALSLDEAELRRRGRRLLRVLPANRGRLVSSSLRSGGGSAPDESFPSVSLQLSPAGSAEELAAALRQAEPPVIATISDDKVLLNLATLLPGDLEPLRGVLSSLFTATGHPSPGQAEDPAPDAATAATAEG